MSRRKGSYSLSSNIEPNVSAPLDARTIADSVEDLTKSDSFSYAYEGMKVYVKSAKATYELIGGDPTNSANWRLFGETKTVQGAKGEDGLSAYEIAKKNGFEGTETEWLASLKGADGKTGAAGKTPVKGSLFRVPTADFPGFHLS